MLGQDALDVVSEHDDYGFDERYQIALKDGEKPRITDTVQRAICGDVFHHEGRLVVVRRTDDGCTLMPITREALDDLINRRCVFTREVLRGRGQDRKLETVDTDAPRYLSENIHGLGEWPLLRELRQVTSVPFLRQDGSVGGLSPGYDATSRCWADVPADLTPPPDQPTDEEALQALSRIEDVFREFPFATKAGFSVALAAILSIVARRAISDSPLFFLDASKSGSGKTLMARTIAMIGSGVDPGLANSGDSEPEFRKTITSFLMTGQPVFVLDNQVGKFGGEAIERLQTAGKWQDRLLNQNRVATLKNEVVTIVTSNNAHVTEDTGRRMLMCRLVPQCERPEEREFDRKDLLAFVKKNRCQLALDAITILRRHIAEGCPQAEFANRVLQDGQTYSMPVKPFGSFESWSRLVRHAVIGLGLSDPVATQEAIQQLDEKFLAEKRFVTTLAAKQPTWSGTAEDLVHAVYSEEAMQDVKAALEGILEEKDFHDRRAKQGSVGYRLRAIKDKRFGDAAIVSAGESRTGIRWAVKIMASSGDAVIAEMAPRPSPQTRSP